MRSGDAPMYRRYVHPIERLRYVARAGSAPDQILVAESVPALAAFARRPGAMLVALRQLIVRQPASPGLLALAAHMVQALEPVDAGWAFVEALDGDTSVDEAEALALEESGGTDVVDSIASGPGETLCPLGTTAWMADARSAGRALVLVTPRGTRLPRLLWQSYIGRNAQHHADRSIERVALDGFDDVLGPDGLGPVSSWRPDCPDVAEIARL